MTLSGRGDLLCLLDADEEPASYSRSLVLQGTGVSHYIRTNSCTSLSLSADLYLGQDLRLSMSTLYFKALLFFPPFLLSVNVRRSQQRRDTNATCTVVPTVSDSLKQQAASHCLALLHFEQIQSVAGIELVTFSVGSLFSLNVAQFWPILSLCVALQSTALLLLNSTFFLLHTAASDSHLKVLRETISDL